jgi:hypothetical protein
MVEGAKNEVFGVRLVPANTNSGRVQTVAELSY